MNYNRFGDTTVNETFHFIEGSIRYLTSQEGGRSKPVFNGYRGQFHYADAPYEVFEGSQHFPDFLDDSPVLLGTTVRTRIGFLKERWDEYHSKRISIGMAFQIQEGAKVVGRGTVTKLDVNHPDSR
jgi:translation elongation factor EF-Tu-like GTPase